MLGIPLLNFALGLIDFVKVFSFLTHFFLCLIGSCHEGKDFLFHFVLGVLFSNVSSSSRIGDNKVFL